MPRFKKDLHDWPSLNTWLYSIGLTDNQIRENFFYSALVDYFPGSIKGSHRVPTEAEISKDRKRLSRTISYFNPDIIVTIGKLSLSKCIGEEIKLLDKFIGKSFNLDPYKLIGKELLIIPLPHPSGASTWYRTPANKKLLNKALTLLRRSLFRS
jgi:uracil-DNA glycosylase